LAMPELEPRALPTRPTTPTIRDDKFEARRRDCAPRASRSSPLAKHASSSSTALGEPARRGSPRMDLSCMVANAPPSPAVRDTLTDPEVRLLVRLPTIDSPAHEPKAHFIGSSSRAHTPRTSHDPSRRALSSVWRTMVRPRPRLPANDLRAKSPSYPLGPGGISESRSRPEMPRPHPRLGTSRELDLPDLVL